jgi:hypothetical protein
LAAQATLEFLLHGHKLPKVFDHTKYTEHIHASNKPHLQLYFSWHPTPTVSLTFDCRRVAFYPLLNPRDWQGYCACPRGIDSEAEILSEAHWTMSASREHNHKTGLLVRSTIFLSRTKTAIFGSSSEQVSQPCSAPRRCVEDDASWSSAVKLDFWW